MTEVRGCLIPVELYYWIEKHVWVRDEGDDLLTIGITDPAQHLAARVVAVTTKKSPVRFLLVSGRPIGEPVAWYGPIVMNTQEQLRQAFQELEQGKFLK